MVLALAECGRSGKVSKACLEIVAGTQIRDGLRDPASALVHFRCRAMENQAMCMCVDAYVVSDVQELIVR